MIGDKALERRLEALRAMGFPTSFAELEARTELPEGTENAADAYERAFAAFVPPSEEASASLPGMIKLPEAGVPLSRPMAQAIADCLSSNRECFALLHQAAGIEHCRYRRDLNDLVPNAAGLRSCARLLKVDSLFQGHQGDSNGVTLSVRDGLRLADSLRRGPVMIDHLARTSLYAEALRGLEWALSATTFTDRQLSELADVLTASEGALDLADVMAGERTYMIEAYKDPSLADGPMFSSRLLKFAHVRRLGLFDSLDYAADSIEASRLASVQRLARFREMEKKAEGLSFLHAVIKTIAPWTTRLVEIDLRLRTHVTLARTVLAIERYRLTIGSVPEQLDELVPRFLDQTPVDPFRGGPIRYRRTEPGYVLGSALDEGGEHRDVNSGESQSRRFIVAR